MGEKKNINVNPDVKAFLLKHPKKAKELGIDVNKL